jgi:hypothetical protein
MGLVVMIRWADNLDTCQCMHVQARGVFVKKPTSWYVFYYVVNKVLNTWNGVVAG